MKVKWCLLWYVGLLRNDVLELIMGVLPGPRMGFPLVRSKPHGAGAWAGGKPDPHRFYSMSVRAGIWRVTHGLGSPSLPTATTASGVCGCDRPESGQLLTKLIPY